jgi:uncharacterized membrane protein
VPNKAEIAHIPGTGRIEAFSDGVIAIIITIMVLELKAPAEADIHSLSKVLPMFLLYAMSFMVVAIMWVNHHQMMHIVPRASAKLLWSNNILLFWMSLIPFCTAYLGEHPAQPLAVTTYGSTLTLCSASWTLLRWAIGQQLEDAELRSANQKTLLKNFGSMIIYLLSAGAAFFSICFSYFVFLLIPALYFLPEKYKPQSIELPEIGN